MKNKSIEKNGDVAIFTSLEPQMWLARKSCCSNASYNKFMTIGIPQFSMR